MENKGINIEEIRAFNAELKQRKEQASALSARVEVYTKELMERCKELSAELGCEVTEENLEQVYNSYAAQLAQTLETGKAVLEKIRNEELLMNNQSTAQNVGQNTVAVQQDLGVANNLGVQYTQQTNSGYNPNLQNTGYGQNIVTPTTVYPNGGNVQTPVFDQTSSFGYGNGTII